MKYQIPLRNLLFTLSRSGWILLVLLFVGLANQSSLSAQYYGMQFYGHEYPLDQRSGLDLTPDGDLEIKDNLDLEFYLRFEPGHQSYYGYVFRMIIGDQNIDLIHGTVPGNDNNFELILGDKTSKIAFPFSIERLGREWLHLQFHMDFKNGEITCRVDENEIKDRLQGYEPRRGFRLMFGANSHKTYPSTDVPAMIIRDVSLKMKQKPYISWSLEETEGTVVHSDPAGKEGVALNPEWLLKSHNTWKPVLNLEVQDTLKSAYDGRNEEWYLVTPDSIIIFDIKGDSLTKIAHEPSSIIGASNHIRFDTISDRLLLYSIDNNYVESYSRNANTWSVSDHGIEPFTSYWQHNSFIPEEGKLRILGGYGYHTYKNNMLEWDQKRGSFKELLFKGEFNPRYLAGLGYNPVDSMYYIVGGYGSESGKQSESPDYYYEILRFSPRDTAFTRVFEFSDLDAGFCFSNSLVFDDKNNLYGLYFNKYEFNNQLQLIKIPLDAPEIIEVGNPLDFKFIDVNSYADLQYSKSENALYVLSTFTADVKTSISLHRIAFPPQVFVKMPEPDKSKIPGFIIVILAGLVVAIVAYPLIKPGEKKKNKGTKPMEPSGERSGKRKVNSIILFGGFQVFDSEGNDITGQFTPLPKKLLLYILLYSLRNEKGVSSNALYETFWFDKSVESARNNRAVNIVKLKSLLEKVESTSISKETGYWKFDFDPSMVYIDYYEYLKKVGSNKRLTKEEMVGLLSIVENSPFLNNTQAEWLDSFKSDISNEIIDTILNYIHDSPEDPEFFMHLTNCIFVFDAVSEEALKVQCRLLLKQGKHSLAKSTYTKFTSEYRQLYDEDFGLSFSQVTEQ